MQNPTDTLGPIPASLMAALDEFLAQGVAAETGVTVPEARSFIASRA